MPLHMTKIAYRSKSLDTLRAWIEAEGEARGEAHMTTRYLPKRHAEMIGGSLYWIMDRAIVARSEILGFEQNPDSRWTIRLVPKLVQVHPKAKRGHQGWRYLTDRNAPPDLAPGEIAGDALPGKVVRELAKLGLV